MLQIASDCSPILSEFLKNFNVSFGAFDYLLSSTLIFLLINLLIQSGFYGQIIY